MNIKRKIIKALFLLTSNPQLLFKLLRCRIIPRWLPLKSHVQRIINGILFEFNFDLDLKIKEMYRGCYEPEVIEVMKSMLKPADVFIDVGANIGYLSAIGAGFVGKNGQVHSFEPVPQYFQRLKRMAMINPDYRIIVNQYALAEEEGTADIYITSRQIIGWDTMIPGLMKKEELKETLKVPVYRLDNYIKQKALNNISLIKIDVEGFEFSVLKGLNNYFENTEHYPVIICEIHPLAYPLLDCTLSQLSEYMRKYTYKAYNIIDIDTEVDITKSEEITNVVFMSSGRRF